MQLRVSINVGNPGLGIPDSTALRHALEELAVDIGQRYFSIPDNVLPLMAGPVHDEYGYVVGRWRLDDLEAATC